MLIPRPEYPRPQMVRDEWRNLNGEWQFEIDNGDSGLERGLLERPLSGRIILPFCPESALSGVGHTDFMSAVWYKRSVRLPAEWGEQNILLHFGASDYDTTVWVDGHEVVRHRGGFTPFFAHLLDLAKCGDEIEITVRARDDNTTPKPRGKQSQRYENWGCFYTRTTGIWQTVWMEPVGECHLRRPRINPEAGLGQFRLEQRVWHNRSGLSVRATLSDGDGTICRVECRSGPDLSVNLDLPIPSTRRRLWCPDDPFLYSLDIELLDESGHPIDHAVSYAGLRGISIDDKAIRLNGEVLFQRLVLDQGYYRDGIMTAPTDASFVQDIELGMAAGFNGARLHQKVFEERYLYHADRLGYLCWGEFGDWGCRYTDVDRHQQHHGITFAAQWAEALERDYSHPCIIGWCPLNETYQEITDTITELDDAASAMYHMTKLLDTTRPVLDASGYSHRVPETDIFDSHDYEQDPAKFAANQSGLAEGKPFLNGPRDRPWNITYRNQPYFVSEFGGIHWSPGAEVLDETTWLDQSAQTHSWGYGASPRTLEEFYHRFAGLCGVLLDNAYMFGYCYTQLTDVFQEENGLFTFDREAKFDLGRLHSIQTRRAAIEERLTAPDASRVDEPTVAAPVNALPTGEA